MATHHNLANLLQASCCSYLLDKGGKKSLLCADISINRGPAITNELTAHSRARLRTLTLSNHPAPARPPGTLPPSLPLLASPPAAPPAGSSRRRRSEFALMSLVPSPLMGYIV
jgi:hypothetical protein